MAGQRVTFVVVLSFVVVHGFIGEVEQFIRVACCVIGFVSYANRNRNFVLSPTYYEQIKYFIEFAYDGWNFIWGGGGHENRKFVPAEAGDVVTFSTVFLQALRSLF